MNPSPPRGSSEAATPASDEGSMVELSRNAVTLEDIREKPFRGPPLPLEEEAGEFRDGLRPRQASSDRFSYARLIAERILPARCLVR